MTFEMRMRRNVIAAVIVIVPTLLLALAFYQSRLYILSIIFVIGAAILIIANVLLYRDFMDILKNQFTNAVDISSLLYMASVFYEHHQNTIDENAQREVRNYIEALKSSTNYLALISPSMYLKGEKRFRNNIGQLDWVSTIKIQAVCNFNLALAMLEDYEEYATCAKLKGVRDNYMNYLFSIHLDPVYIFKVSCPHCGITGHRILYRIEDYRCCPECDLTEGDPNIISKKVVAHKED